MSRRGIINIDYEISEEGILKGSITGIEDLKMYELLGILEVTKLQVFTMQSFTPEEEVE